MKRILALTALLVGLALIVASVLFRYPATIIVGKYHVELFVLEIIAGAVLLIVGALLVRTRA